MYFEKKNKIKTIKTITKAILITSKEPIKKKKKKLK